MKTFSLARRTAAAFLTLAILCAAFLTSCDLSAADTNATETTDSPSTVIYNTVNVTGNSGSISYAAASGLRSAVSVYCTFETTSYGRSPWNPYPSTQTYYTTGSGVIYGLEEDGSAFIITNYHVVYDSSSNTENHVSDQIYVYLYGMESEDYAIPVTFIGGSANYDIAVLRAEKSEILLSAAASGSAAAVTVGNSDLLMPGDTTVAIGNPSSTSIGGISVTKGIVSVDSEYITMTASDNSGEVSFRVIRTDTPINSGNSGGGLFNEKGELIGIVNAKINSTDIENIGYALPSAVVRAIADNIIDYCFETECTHVMRGLLGITVSVTGYYTEYDAENARLVKGEEVSVYEVSADGLGSGILKAGDVVKSITVGERTAEVTRQYHLIDAMLDVRAGDEVSLTVVRNGEEKTVSVTVTEACLTEY